MIADNRCLIVKGVAFPPPDGLHIRNHLDPGMATFKGRSRKGLLVNEVIVHESVTTSSAGTISVLTKRGLGVHLMIGPNGNVTQHGDLADLRLSHGAPHNTRSVGIEVVNPYYPKLAKEDSPWKRIISDAPWADGGAYVLPTPKQAEALAILLRWLTSRGAIGLSIPRHWIGWSSGRLHMDAISGARKAQPGIYAHHYFAHADGAWPILYAWLRLEAGMSPCLAYDEAILRATGARKSIDVSDLRPSLGST